jgi:hypothetical protein
MSGARLRVAAIEFDALGVAAGSAVISGALSILDPFLTALAATLTALGFAAWVAALGRTPSAASSYRRRSGRIALAWLGGSVAFFVAAPSEAASIRGLMIGLSLVPLWLVDRHTGHSGVPGTEGSG